MTNEPRDKLRALFLTVLMVLSVFALTVSFAGTAAAANKADPKGGVALDDPDNPGDVLIEITFNQSMSNEGSLAATDFEFFLNNGTQLSDVNSGFGFSTDTNVYATGANTPGATNDQQLVIHLTTSVQPARFDKVNITDSTSNTADLVRGNVSVTPTSTTIAEDDTNKSAFRGENIAVVSDEHNEKVEVQDDDGGFYFDGSTGTASQVHVFDSDGRDTSVKYWFLFDDRSDVDFTSPQGDRRLTLRNLGLTVEATDNNLTTNDDIEADIEANAGNRGQDVILYYEDNETEAASRTITSDSDGTDTESFANNGAADYNITVIDVSTGIEVNTDTITVTEVTGAASFGQTVYSEERGDVVNISVEISNRDTAELFIGDSDINYGQEVDLEDGNDDGVVHVLWNTNDGSISPADSDDTATEDNTPESASNDIDASFPVDAGSYPLNVSIDQEEDGVATIELVDRSFDDARTWVAPGGQSTSEVEDIADNAVQMSSTAKGDKFVLAWHASGVFGFLDSNYNLSEGSADAQSEGLYLEIEQTNEGGNQDPVVLNASNVSLVLDEDNNVFYTVIDSGDSDDFPGMDDGQDYEATLTLNESSDFIDADPDTAGTEKETLSTTFSVLEQDASINGLNASDVLTVNPSLVDISGTATLAPGTNLTVRVKSTTTGVPYLLTVTDVTIGPNGTWTAEGFNFTGRTGTTFDVTVSVSGNKLVTEEGAVLPPPTASVTFNDQDSPRGQSVVVQSVTMSRGGFVAIHSGSAGGPVIGSSKFLPAGTHTNVRIALDEPISEETTLVAMPHLDTDGDNVYEFPDADGPYVADGAPVTDGASVAYTEETVRTVTAESPTPMIVTRTVQAESPTPREVEVTRTVTVTQTPGQPGFGVAIAVVALLAAALLAVRRRD